MSKCRYSLQVVSPGVPDCPPSLMVKFDSEWFLFNCGEGTQRACTEHKLRLANRCSSIFITRPSWDCIGGFPGMLLTLADAGSKGLSLYGPQGLKGFVYSTRHFMQRKDFSLDVAEWEFSLTSCRAEEYFAATSNEIFQSSLLHITTIGVFKSPDGSKRRNIEQEPCTEESWNVGFKDPCDDDFKVRNRLKRTAERTERIVRTNLQSLAYICRGPEMRGQFLAQKAKELGIKPGPDFSRLARGESVINEFGVEIKPEQVMEAKKKGAVWIVVDIPTREVAACLAEQESIWSPFKPNGSEHLQLRFIVHMLGPKVAQSPEFLAFSGMFGPRIKNVILSPDLGPDYIIFHAQAQLQEKLSTINRTMHSLPHQSRECAESAVCNAIAACPLDEILIEPVGDKLEFNLKRHFTPLSEFENSQAFALQHDSPVTVIPLGTGSAIPAKSRNVSSTLLLIFSEEDSSLKRAILLDCGEGTLGQLYRAVGKHHIALVMKKLSLIFVSHMHADHHVGLTRLIQRKHYYDAETSAVLEDGNRLSLTNNSEKLSIIGPKALELFLNEYQNLENFHKSLLYDFFDSELLASESCSISIAGVANVRTIPVFHCYLASAVVLQLTNGLKIAFSGDCRPSKAFVLAGKGADLLIHEATFDDTLETEAVEKRHCTVSEAITVGQDMEAKLTLLTHFSQRYPKLPESFSTQGKSSKVLLAFDLMQIPVPFSGDLEFYYERLFKVLND